MKVYLWTKFVLKRSGDLTIGKKSLLAVNIKVCS